MTSICGEDLFFLLVFIQFRRRKYVISTKLFVKLVKAAKASHYAKFYNLSIVPAPSGYPTAAECFAFFDSCLLPLGSRPIRHLPKLRLRLQTFFRETKADFETTSLTLKFYPQKVQKLFCAKMRFLMCEQRQPISLFCAQLFVNKLFRFRKTKMSYYAVTHLNFSHISST